MKCKVCGKRFRPTKEKIYLAKGRTSLADVFKAPAPTMECFDCPKCGCQIMANIREEKVIKERSEDVKKFAAELIAEFSEWEESLANLPYDGKSMVRQGSRRIQNAANRFYEKAE